MKSKVTVDMIMSLNPCDRYDREKVEQLFKSVCGRSKTMSLKNALRLNIPVEDIYWLVFRNEFMTDLEMHKTAIFCWEKIARPIWEKNYPNDKRPHEAVRIKKLWIKKKATDEELDAAWDAAWAAAWAAAGAAADDAARAAADDAARAAAWAAADDAARAAAWDAAWAAAWAAADDAARAAANKKILSHVKTYCK
jgi:hypothetical protein